jgi:hypothetical protein
MLKTGMEKGSVETMARPPTRQTRGRTTERVGKETKLFIVRYFGAPVERVKVWIDPVQIKRGGDLSYTSPVVKIDFREGEIPD